MGYRNGVVTDDNVGMTVNGGRAMRTDVRRLVVVGAVASVAALSWSLVSAADFTVETKLTPPDGDREHFFADSVESVAVSGDIVVVGAHRDDDNGRESGSAYVFEASTGNLVHKLTAPDGEEFDQFGYSVAMSEDTVVVGAHRDDLDTPLHIFAQGSAYVFEALTGNLVHKLTAPDGGTNDNLGTSVAVSGDTIVVGALGGGDILFAGAAYVFEASTGNLLHKLIAPDDSVRDNFGESVAVSADTVVVGAWGDDDNGSQSGAAYVFEASTGNLVHKLTAPDSERFDWFGRSVAVSEDTVVVGAWLDDVNGDGLREGSAYVFEASTGSLVHKLTAPDGEQNDLFGRSVALSGNTVAIGAVNGDDDNAGHKGVAYVFEASTGDFVQKLTAPDLPANFGNSVAASGDTVAVGEPGDNSGLGAAYVFMRVVDSDGDGVNDDVDVCSETELPDTVTRTVKKNRYIADATGVFGDSGYTVADTGGCSAAQIIAEAGLGNGHVKFGLSKGALKDWVATES